MIIWELLQFLLLIGKKNNPSLQNKLDMDNFIYTLNNSNAHSELKFSFKESWLFLVKHPKYSH